MAPSIADLLQNPPPLPVADSLGAVSEALTNHTLAVIQAPPGTGKTTLVPPLLANRSAGKVLVSQPRRIAARAGAARIAQLLGEPVGHTVGYAVRGERKASRETRIEFVTAGLLVRRLQADPELDGVDAVILDEIHEHHLDADLATAFLLDIKSSLRPDLTIVAMSATLDAHATAELLHRGGGELAEIVEIPGLIHPVETIYSAPPARPLGPRGETREFLAHVAEKAISAAATTTHDVLVFLPGVREIAQVDEALRGRTDAHVLHLHGSLPSARQDAVLASRSQRDPQRIILATAVAESSITVPGVRVVVDAGLSREPRMDYARQMGGLVTVMVPQAAGEQRAGRAGREGPGTVYRCMSESTWAALAKDREPELRVADLAPAMLEAAQWGAPGFAGLALPAEPPPEAIAAATHVLQALGATDADGRLTPEGRALADIPVHPRHARALLDSAPDVGSRRAAQIVALLETPVRCDGADLAAGWRAFNRPSHPNHGEWTREAKRLEGYAQSTSPSQLPLDDALSAVSARAWPDRIARKRGGGYVLAGGTGAELPAGSPLEGQEWLAIADLDRSPGSSNALIRAASPCDENAAHELGANLLHTETVDELTAKGPRCWEVDMLGAIELRRRPIPVTPGAAARLKEREVASAGVGILHWTDAARSLRNRLAFLHRVVGEPWPDVSDTALAADLTWLAPDLAGSGSLATIDVTNALRRLLPWPDAARLDELAPERIQSPAGTSAKIDYSGERPSVRFRVQECFGWATTPTIAGVPLQLELLSPASRPVAITDDVASFWRQGYPQVRSDLRGRYPRHPWPEDPWTEPPTRRAKPRA